LSVTQTRTTTQTSTVPKIIYVTRKVQADFLAIMDTYGYFSEDYAKKLITDIRHFLDEEVVDKVKFIWTESGGNRVLFEYEYVVLSGDFGFSDDSSGGITYRSDLAKASFGARVIYNDRWKRMDDSEKGAVRTDLCLTWGPAGELDYSGGQRTQDRTYSKDGYGLARSQFNR
jgi:hypothetical protein